MKFTFEITSEELLDLQQGCQEDEENEDEKCIDGETLKDVVERMSRIASKFHRGEDDGETED